MNLEPIHRRHFAQFDRAEVQERVAARVEPYRLSLEGLHNLIRQLFATVQTLSARGEQLNKTAQTLSALIRELDSGVCKITGDQKVSISC